MFRRIAGSAFDAMPETLQHFHGGPDIRTSAGRCRVEVGGSPVARFLVWLLSLPYATDEAPITVTLRREADREVWIREIGGRRFQSVMHRTNSNLLSETIGPVRFFFRLDTSTEGFSLYLTRCRVLGVPLPRALLPVVAAREVSNGSGIAFDISAGLPLVGLIVAYRGELTNSEVPEGERPGQPVMLFDGVCNFCNGGVDFFLKRDPFGRIRFAAMQSPRGLTFLLKHDLPTHEYKTFIVLDGERIIRKSDGVLHLTGYLSWPWPLLRVFSLVPRFIRDRIYDLFAQNRYKLMGKRDVCRVPTAAERERFLL